jgi:hypothetical protein
MSPIPQYISQQLGGPKIAIKGKYNDNSEKLRTAPGPGLYNPSYQYRSGFSNIQYTMSGRPVTASSAYTPGPGQYPIKGDVEQRKSLGKIGKSSRNAMSSSSEAPGPGAYNYSTGIGADAPKIGYQDNKFQN